VMGRAFWTEIRAIAQTQTATITEVKKFAMYLEGEIG
jgi:predicted DNA-binding ribbon-helix-helix protein